MQVQEGEQFHFAVVMTPRHHFFQTIYNMLYIYKKSEMHHVSSQYASPYHIIDSVQYFRISIIWKLESMSDMHHMVTQEVPKLKQKPW
jgi:hypothetical protein